LIWSKGGLLYFVYIREVGGSLGYPFSGFNVSFYSFVELDSLNLQLRRVSGSDDCRDSKLAKSKALVSCYGEKVRWRSETSNTYELSFIASEKVLLLRRRKSRGVRLALRHSSVGCASFLFAIPRIP
jgi:hypothetical protein